MIFTLQKETKNYLKYKQVDGINVLYIPKAEFPQPPITIEVFAKATAGV